jgi:cell wall assembly regulator SMI1
LHSDPFFYSKEQRLMHRQWEKLEEWLKANKRAVLADLNPPADDAAVRDLQSKLRVLLPDDFIGCLKIHNGQRGEAEPLFGADAFLPSRRVLMSWSTWNDLLEGGDFDGQEARPDGTVKPVWWSAGWIPFASNGGGDYLCLDMDPPTQGKMGQIIRVYHDVADRIVIAPGFGPWFDRFVNEKCS